MEAAINKLLSEFPVIEEKCRQNRAPINLQKLTAEAEAWLSRQQK